MPLAECKVGSKDSNNRIIRKIYAYDKDLSYLIYTAEGDNKLLLDGDISKLDSSPSIQLLLEQIIALTPDDTKKRDKVFSKISIGIVLCMSGKTEMAEKSLTQTFSRLANRSIQLGQLYYLAGTCIIATILVAVSSIILYSMKEKLGNIELILFTVTSGTLGGLLSVMINLKKIDIDIDTGRTYSVVSGASRTIISILGSFFLFLAIKGGLLFQHINVVESNYSLYALCFIAGFSETLVPNNLKKIEDPKAK